MKRLILSVMLLVAAVGMASAQKFALVDMEYIQCEFQIGRAHV